MVQALHSQLNGASGRYDVIRFEVPRGAHRQVLQQEQFAPLWQQFTTNNISLVSDMFAMPLVDTFSCDDCKKATASVLPAFSLQLPLPNSSVSASSSLSLLNCLSNFFSISPFLPTDMKKCYNCEKKGVAGEQCIRLCGLAPFLVLNLKRFGLGLAKRSDRVSAPLILDLTNTDYFTDLAKNPGVSPTYHLLARIHHHGVNISSGHYTADVAIPLLSSSSSSSNFNFDSSNQNSVQWLRFNDTHVTPLSIADVEAPSDTVYTLIYRSA
jgi:ubiquitin C-terminal hydrolase